MTILIITCTVAAAVYAYFTRHKTPDEYCPRCKTELLSKNHAMIHLLEE